MGELGKNILSTDSRGNNMTRITPEEVEGLVRDIEVMYDTGALTDNSYYKCMVSMASEYITNHSDADNCLVLLNRCPPEYFQFTIKKQMEEDNDFFAIMLEMTYKLVKFGIIEGDTQPTMSLASA
jgi:hypothetical protein